MALFQKRPDIGHAIQFYTLGQNQTTVIAGLGNPGKEYEHTRHNIGFACLDAFAQANDFDPWIEKKDLKCWQATGTVGGVRVILIKPATFMNLSGEAVQAVLHFYKLSAEKLVVVHDELDIPFGQIRLRMGGGSAGHNGLKSIIQHIGEQFGRVRVGIGPKTTPEMDSADFVLGKFTAKEQGEISSLTRETNAILSEYAYSNQQLPQETRSFII